MTFLKSLFSEESSVSMMRVMCMIALLAAVGLAFTNRNETVLYFLTAAFGGKVGQKFAETKSNP